MGLLLFWIKVTVKRVLWFLKRFPVIGIGVVIIIAAFIVAGNNITIDITLNPQTSVMAISILFIVALLVSLKEYHVMPVLLVYSKSKFQNRIIRVGFFIIQAFTNNIPLFIFTIIVLIGYIKIGNPAFLLIIKIFSLALSFLLMFEKNNRSNKGTGKVIKKKSRINPALKSIISDYLTSGFLQAALICIGLFLLVIVEILMNLNSVKVLENPAIIFMGLVVIQSFGFISIIDSIPHINWRFQAIINPCDFCNHIKRTMIFLGGIFSILIILFIFISFFVSKMLLAKYLYCIFALLFLSINIAFTMNNKLIKTIFFVSAAVFTLWISTMRTGLLLILPAPLLIAFIKAKNEYRDWYLL